MTVGEPKEAHMSQQNSKARPIIAEPDPRALFDVARINAEDRIANSTSRIESQRQLAHGAIKALTVVNGGAILSLLTFLGNHPGYGRQADLRLAFICFGAGLTAAILTYLAAYFSEAEHMDSDTMEAWIHQQEMTRQPVPPEWPQNRDGHARRGRSFVIAGLACVLSSIAMFVAGSFFALAGLF